MFAVIVILPFLVAWLISWSLDHLRIKNYGCLCDPHLRTCEIKGEMVIFTCPKCSNVKTKHKNDLF